MKYNLYSIRDIHTGFMTPMIDQNDMAAKRNFAHAVMQSSSLMNSHPGDYVLYRIGEFDTDAGKIVSCLPDQVCSATEVM